MFGFVKKIFASAIMFFGCNISSVLKRALVKNQECKIRPEIRNININERLFFSYNIKVNKCSGSCDNIMIHIQ